MESIHFAIGCVVDTKEIYFCLPIKTAKANCFWVPSTNVNRVDKILQMPNTSNIWTSNHMKETDIYCCFGKLKVENKGSYVIYYIIGAIINQEMQLNYLTVDPKIKPYHNTIRSRLSKEGCSKYFLITSASQEEMLNGNKYFFCNVNSNTYPIMSNGCRGPAEVENSWNILLGLNEPRLCRKRARYAAPTVAVPAVFQTTVANNNKIKSRVLGKKTVGNRKVEIPHKNMRNARFEDAKTLYANSQYAQSRKSGAFVSLVRMEQIIHTIQDLRQQINLAAASQSARGVDGDEIVNAVITKLFEDIGWRMSEPSPIPAQLGEIFFDIDQVIIANKLIALVSF